MRKQLAILTAALALVALPVVAGEWHTGTANLCTDCHTMHFSMQHEWESADPIGSTPAEGGNWLGATGPNEFLLKAPVNELCLACHNGQTFAPDVLMANMNSASETWGRSAGALNEEAAGEGYESWMGHTLDSTSRPPGYDATSTPAGDAYPVGSVLECTSCHTQHGLAGVYRNLGPRGLGTTNLPSYVISTTNDNTKDVWVNIASGYLANTADPAVFSPYYDAANVFYNRNDKTVGTAKTSNGIDSQCAVCHGTFHGGVGDPGIGGSDAGESNGGHEFLRHPTSQEILNGGSHGTSNLARFVASTAKVKVYADDYTTYADASPGCVSCHKAHGNQNPFGLVFLSRTATSGAVTEEGANGTEAASPAGAPSYARGYRNLCGQCHGQGN